MVYDTYDYSIHGGYKPTSLRCWLRLASRPWPMGCCCSVFMYINPKIETFETWKCPVYIIELPSRKHFSASFVVEPEHQQIFRVATNTSQKKSAENDQF